ncbi:MAG TPA: ATP-binding protein, partial [Polyangia bacterium]
MPMLTSELPGADALRATIWRLAAQTELGDRELIQRLLECVGDACGVSRACFNETDARGDLVTTLEWCAPGVAPSIGACIPGFILQSFLDRQELEIAPADSAGMLPRSARARAVPVLRDLAAAYGVSSVLYLPFTVDGRLEGAVSLDQCRPVPPEWSRPLRPVMADVVQIITQTIARKRTEAALRESERRYHELVDVLPQMVYECDLEGRLTFLNRRALELLGLTAADLRAGVNLLDLIVPEDRHQAIARGRAVKAGERDLGSHEYRLVRRNGDPLPVISYPTPVVREGTACRVTGVVIDLTEQKQAEAERQRLEAKMQQAQKLESLGLLAGGIAHDFNNLLVSILGNAELALLDLGGKSTAHRRLERIKRAAQRASELANQMLAYSGRGQVTVESVDLGAVVADMAGLLEAAVAQRGALRLEVARALPPVQVDVTQLRQIVMNLILNAAEALDGEAGRIEVRTGSVHEDRESLAAACCCADDLGPGEFVFLEVADTGHGMDAETRARVFDPFFTTKFAGRGLGLAVVLGIVRRHRGAIQVTSAPGRGTTFRVLLPVAAGAGRAPAEAAAPPAWRGRGAVLVIDDE